ncbi:MAG: phosphoglucosamine mutase [Bacillota bacterium]|nr:phosphoglucosamine mutase [Bacillota bacterium]
MTRLFGTDGVRGLANTDLSPELAFNLGFYGGEIFKKTGNGDFLVGRDTRHSGQMLKSALVAGLMAAGLNVIDLGIVSTPLVAYLVKEGSYAGGAVISASHNPYEYNGIKFFDTDGFKLTDQEEDLIQKMIEDQVQVERKTFDQIGTLRPGQDLIPIYQAYIKSLARFDFKGLKIGVDCGNGALYKLGPAILEDLGAQVIAINTQPDGKNINKACGSTNPDLISKLVVDQGCDLGFSFDGDADRLIAVDEKGRVIDGDHMLAIFAKDLKDKGSLSSSRLVGTVMTNMGLDAYLEGLDMEVVRSQVGDRYVLEEMLKGHDSIGGEQSGHIIFLDHNTTGDGLATGVHLVNAILESGEKPSVLNDRVKNYPQVLVNAHVDNSKKHSYMDNDLIRREIEKIQEDFGKTGRVVIRPSGTEPLVRVMIEGKDQDQIDQVARDLAAIIEDQLK